MVPRSRLDLVAGIFFVASALTSSMTFFAIAQEGERSIPSANLAEIYGGDSTFPGTICSDDPGCAPKTLCATASEFSCRRKYDTVRKEGANFQNCLTPGGEAYCTVGNTYVTCVLDYDCDLDDLTGDCFRTNDGDPSGNAPSYCHTTL
jgi:hypothetical protein